MKLKMQDNVLLRVNGKPFICKCCLCNGRKKGEFAIIN